MSLVGDIILELRARIPDAPSVLNPPNMINAVGIVDPSQAGLPLGSTQQIAITATNTWGETQNASMATVTLTGSQNAIQVFVQAAPPPLYQNINGYQTGTPGGVMLDQWIYPITSSEMNIVIPQPGVVPNHTGGPPARPTAFNPDTDGNFIGAYTAYRLLKRALDEMVKIAGGIVDVTGVRSIINTSMYRLQSPFYTFVNAWYDGYPMDIVPRNFMYLRNSAAGFSGILSYEQDGPQQVIQVWPQSNRNGGNTTLAAPMGISDTSFQLTDGSGFLSIGLAMVDQEVMAFSSASPFPVTTPQPVTLQGVLRGMGGTDIVAHSAGAPVQELNIRLSGYRMAKTYQVGQALQTIMVPQSWETPLVLHMLSQVRSMEQDEATSKALLADFVQMAEKIAKGSRLGRVKPRQIPIWGQNTSDARNVNGIGFGWLIN